MLTSSDDGLPLDINAANRTASSASKSTQFVQVLRQISQSVMEFMKQRRTMKIVTNIAQKIYLLFIGKLNSVTIKGMYYTHHIERNDFFKVITQVFDFSCFLVPHTSNCWPFLGKYEALIPQTSYLPLSQQYLIPHTSYPPNLGNQAIPVSRTRVILYSII